MKRNKEMVKDPVCGMMVPEHMNAIEYQGMHFAFCTEQCKERFLANPRLYIGGPGQPAPMLQAKEILKCRRMLLSEPLSREQADRLNEWMQTLMGIYEVDVSGRELSITYDLMMVTAEQIEAKLLEAGMSLGGGWGERLRRAFIHYVEENEVANLEVLQESHVHGDKHRGE
jgi:YHS domain-containing protein